jgi:hypothetical protein
MPVGPGDTFDILDSGENRTRYTQIRDLQGAAKVLNFLTSNNISSLAELREKVGDYYDRQFAVGDKLKPVKRRIKTLDEHIKYADNFKKYRGHKAQYDKLYAEYKTAKKSTGFFAEGKAQKTLNTADEYRESNHAEIGEVEIIRKAAEEIARQIDSPQKNRAHEFIL